MPRKGRPPNAIPHKSIELWLPAKMLLEVQVYLPRDLITGKVKHGAWSAYFSQLAREDLERKAQKETQNAN